MRNQVIRTSKAKPTAKVPVSAHPAFPAIVALWFAALFGIGSMVLPVVLIEKVITITGIASIVQSMAPPLGATARIVIALAASGVGAIGGIYIARKVVENQGASHPAPRRSIDARARSSGVVAPAVKRPISAHEELGERGFDAPVDDQMEPIAGRRRALSLSDESVRSEFLDHAPLPGSSLEQEQPVDDTLDLSVFGKDVTVLGGSTEPVFGERVETDRAEAFPKAEPFGSSTLSSPPEPGEQVRPLAEPGRATEQRAAPLAPPRDLQENNVAAQTGMADTAPGRPFSAPNSVSTVPAEPSLTPPPAAKAESENIDRPLGELSIAGLVSRFARSLEQHRSASASGVADSAEIDGIAFTMPPARRGQADMAAPAPSSFGPTGEPAADSVSSPYVPDSLRPISIDEGGEDGAMPDFDLGSMFAQHEDEAAMSDFVDDGDEGEEDVASDGYPSLLAMKSPFNPTHEAVRIEDEIEDDAAIEPIVVFPGQGNRQAAPAPDGMPRDVGQVSARPSGFRPFDAPEDRIAAAEQGTAHVSAGPAPASAPRTDTAETEKRLREALEKLQKMSGVA